MADAMRVVGPRTGYRIFLGDREIYGPYRTEGEAESARVRIEREYALVTAHFDRIAGAFSCRCGAKTDGVARDARDKCPTCGTFSTDHPYQDAGLDSDGDPYMRCMDCDIRSWSHR